MADAGPLIALGKLEQLGLLPRLFDRALAPEAVIAECLADMRLPAALAIERAIQSQQLQRIADPEDSPQLAAVLDSGERAAILTAQQLGASILVDEKRARSVARSFGLRVIGTLGVIVLARRRGLIGAARPLLTSLKDAGYFIGKDLLQAALKLCGE